MRCFTYIFCCVLILLPLLGCVSGHNYSELGSGRSPGQFPDFLVGIWKADEFKWGFKFEPDGSISKMVHVFAGQINLKESVRELEGPDDGTYAVFTTGPCEAHYDEAERKLSVKIVLDYYKMQLPQGALEGNSEDYFDGVVSEDNKTWHADWRSYTWLNGAEPPDVELIKNNPEKLIFKKIVFEKTGGYD